jgi:fatty acid desaturase
MQPKPKKHQEYLDELMHHIPKEAFAPATYKLIPMFAHLTLIIAMLVLCRLTNEVSWTCLFAAISGLSIACIFLYCHELTHGTIVKNEFGMYLMELLFWPLSGMPPTLWRVIHNRAHHTGANSYADPDRRTFKSEKNFWNTIYNTFIYPNKKLRFSLTVGFAMLFYTGKHIASALYPEGKKPAIVTFKPKFTKKEKKKIKWELVYILFFQAGIGVLLGWKLYLLFSLVSWVMSSTILISMIITQHLINPVFVDQPDPMLTATSVRIPKLLDWLIDYHSFHIEHHVLPGVNFDFYPHLSTILLTKYPDRYTRKPFISAIIESYDRELFIDDPLQ